MTTEKFRLVTRSDMDGLVCAVLLNELDMIDDIKFVHPKDVQDGIIDISRKDITTNLPYAETAYLSFDHHESEVLRVGEKKDNHIIDPKAASAARVVFDYYGGKEVFPGISDEMMFAVDKADAAQYELNDILNPDGWELLSFLMDARTGLGRFRTFRVSNYALMMDLIVYCRNHTIEEILALPDVKERVELFFDHQEKSKEQIRNCTTIHKNLAVLDLREEETIFSGNRFMIYALFPECNISMHVMWGKLKQNTVYAVGKSIINRTSKTDIGALMLEYGGGGHEAAGTCQVENARAEEIKEALSQKLID